MRKIPFVFVAALGLVALSFSAALAEESPEVQRLKAESAQLKDDLAKTRNRLQALEARSAELSATVARLQAEVEDLRRPPKDPASKPAAPLSRQLDIRVDPGDWGDAEPADIQKVLVSAAGELWRHCPTRRLRPIIARRSEGGPGSFYEEGPNGEYVVRLDVKGTYWGQFAYQFAHEFCHVLAGRTKSRKNQWFVEALGETGSLYAVKQMGVSWKTSPPYPNWRTFAPALTKYAEEASNKPGDDLPADATLAPWFKTNEEALRADPYLRDKNRTVAKRLLALFEKQPQAWDAVGGLNQGPLDSSESFRSYLAAWHAAAPADHKPFVKDVMGLFGF